MTPVSRYQLPDVSGGFLLEGKRGWFGVLVPESATNLITNPSFETGITGYTQVGAGAFSAVATYQRRGAKAGAVEIQNNNEGIYFTVPLTSGQVYTFSADIYGYPGARYCLQAETVGGATLIGRRYYTGKGYWERGDLTFTAPSTGNFAIALYCTDKKVTHTIYTDGWQCEASAYPTSYIDGDQVGFLASQTAYYWHGLPHASRSTRIYNTGSGGKEMNLLDIGFRILAVIGLGLAPMVHAATPISTGGAYYQRSTYQTRQFTLVGAIAGDSLPELDRVRAELLSVLQPGRLPDDQPLVLRYHRVDDDTGDETEVINIQAVYEGGMEGSIDNFNQQRLGLTFRQYLPYIQGDGEIGTALDFADTLGASNNIFYRDPDGSWTLMGSGTTQGAGTGWITVVEQAPNGDIYAAGYFDSIDGVAAQNLAYWDGSAWNGINGPAGATLINSICWDSSGSNMYVGGNFTTIGGVSANRVAKWDGANWSALGTGRPEEVRAVVFGPDGYLYSTGGLNNSIGQWSGTNWTEITGLTTTGIVRDLAFGPDGYLYAGGPAYTIDSIHWYNVNYWNGSVWTHLMLDDSTVTNSVYELEFGPDGRLYAGGAFQVSSVWYGGVKVYSGTIWETVGEYFELDGGVSSSVISEIAVLQDGSLYAGGNFDENAGVIMGGLAYFAGTEWVPSEFALSADMEVNAVLAAVDGKVYIGGKFDLTGGSAAGVTAVDNDYAAVYPVIEFTGPGRMVGIVNNTTGAAIYFKNLTLLAGERVKFVTDPLNFSIVSNLRGSLASYLMASSPQQFELVPGENSISLLMTGTDGSSAAVLHYHPNYLSLDGATR